MAHRLEDEFYKQYPTFADFKGKGVARRLFNFISSPKSVERMCWAVDEIKFPPILGIMSGLDKILDSVPKNKKFYRIKQLCGVMICFIMIKQGYTPNRNERVNIKNRSRHFKSSTKYIKVGR